MKRFSGTTKLAIATLILSVVCTQVNGVEEGAKVDRVTAATSDGLSFTAWAVRQNIKFGQDIVIHYRVDNRSNKPIYLVRDNTSKTVIEEDSIVFPIPYVSIGGHEEYDYGFTKVGRHSSYHGQMKVSKGAYKEPQSWSINVGFGYVTDITGLNPSPDQIKDPAPFKSLLNSRIKTLLLCGLTVEK